MILKLYKTSDSENKLNKTLENEIEIAGALKEKISVESPSLILNIKNIQINNFNYCFIEDFNRYYFIVDKRYFHNDLVELDLKIDVLMSFKDDINNFRVSVKRTNALNANSKVLDCEVENQKTFIGSIPLNDVFSEKPKLYMATVKGV